MIIRFNKVGSVGVVKDIPSYELPLEAWSDALNVRFLGESVEKFDGQVEVFNCTISAITQTQQIAESPWFVMPVEGNGSYHWLYAGPNHIYAATPNANRINLTRTAAGQDMVYSANATLRWTGVQLAGLPILNNGVDVPQIQTTPGTVTRFRALRWDQSASVNWEDSTSGPYTCSTFRAFRDYALALGMSEGGISYPRRMRWSHPVSSGTEPMSWDENATGSLAGAHDFDETGDELIDCQALYDTNIVYKRNNTWAMQWIGGNAVFGFRPLFNFGLLSRECVVTVNGQHICLTDNDVLAHNGQTPTSIITPYWRRTLFADIDGDYYRNTFMVANRKRSEVWICYPETGVSEAYWPNKALIWNWQYNTWYMRELPKASHIASGYIRMSPLTDEVGYTWDTVPGTWDNTNLAWNARSYFNSEEELLMAMPEDSASSSPVPRLVRIGNTDTFQGSPITARVERLGLALTGMDRYGNPKIDLRTNKLVKGVWPYVDAPDGTTVQVWVGTQRHIGDTIRWHGPYDYVCGTSRWLRMRAMGRLISFRFATTTSVQWRLTGYDVDVETVGLY